MKYWKNYLYFILFGIFITLTPGLNDDAQAFKEPSMPKMDAPLDSEKETKINEVVMLPPLEAFQRLHEIDFIVDGELMERAIFERFTDNRKEAIDLVLNLLLSYTVVATADGEIIDFTRSFYVARKILQVFPSESWPGLMGRFKNANPVVRGNILLLSGKIAAGPSVTKLLVEALSDKDVYGEKNELMEGDPMRVCDLAYNQLVLRFMIPNVLRTIGPVHMIEDRDFHIDKLKAVMKAELDRK